MLTTIKNLKITCHWCPTQAEAETEDGNIVYLRYRWGRLTMGIGKNLEKAIANASKNVVWTSEDEIDGYMDIQEMLTRCKLIEKEKLFTRGGKNHDVSCDV